MTPQIGGFPDLPFTRYNKVCTLRRKIKKVFVLFIYEKRYFLEEGDLLGQSIEDKHVCVLHVQNLHVFYYLVHISVLILVTLTKKEGQQSEEWCLDLFQYTNFSESSSCRKPQVSGFIL